MNIDTFTQKSYNMYKKFRKIPMRVLPEGAAFCVFGGRFHESYKGKSYRTF